MRKDRIARKMMVLRMERDSLISDLNFFKEQDLTESETRQKEITRYEMRVEQINNDILNLHFEYNQ